MPANTSLTDATGTVMDSNSRTNARFLDALSRMRRAGFIFIHINKTGGTSIRNAFGIDGYQHRTASQIRALIGVDAWQSLFSFSVIRNPWDRLVSIYHWRVRTNQTFLAEKPVPFKEWLWLCLSDKDSVYVKNSLMLAPQSYWLSDLETGEIIVTELLRFENLRSDFDCLTARLDVSVERLPHEKKTRHAHYLEYFDPEDIELVEAEYRQDIVNFGYNFGE